MTNQELTTAALEGFPFKVAVINNGNLGMVRQWQTLFYDQHYSHTKLREENAFTPDFVRLAELLAAKLSGSRAKRMSFRPLSARRKSTINPLSLTSSSAKMRRFGR